MTLKDHYKENFHIGAAVNIRSIETHKDVIIKEFSSITCENEMKFSRVSVDGENYDFTEGDKIYNFAKDNNLALRGHTLLWHKQTPMEIFENTSREKLIQTYKNHVDKMAERYGEYIYCWDVANEVICDKTDNFFRDSPWYNIIGDDFCDIAFTYAKKALPNAQLCYNDYNECNPEKSQKIYKLVKGMLERGVPVDVLGLQAHMNIVSPAMDEVKRAFDMYSKLGIKLHITELDVSLFASGDTSKINAPTAEMLMKQEKMFIDLFNVYKEYKEIVDCVTLWGVADDETWLDNFPVKQRKNWPLLFDMNHKRKSFYEKLI